MSAPQAGELERAKAQAATQLSSALEVPSALAEDIATQARRGKFSASANKLESQRSGLCIGRALGTKCIRAWIRKYQVLASDKVASAVEMADAISKVILHLGYIL